MKIRNHAAEQTLKQIGEKYLSQLKSLEPPIRQMIKDRSKVAYSHRQRGGPIVTPVRTPKQRPPSHASQGYQVVDIPRDGHCLFLACIEAMAHNRLTLPSTWLSTPRQHHRMRTALINTCANELHEDPKYASLKEGLSADQTLFPDLCDRIKRSAYGGHTEIALIASKYNLEIIFFENGTQQWLQRPTGNYQQKHIIALRWCRESKHWDWMKRVKPLEEMNSTDNSNEHNRVNHRPESPKIGQSSTDTDNLSPPSPQASNRSRQPKNKFSRCLIPGNTGMVDFLTYSDDLGEEVIYSQESPKRDDIIRNFDWDLDRFVEYRSPFKQEKIHYHTWCNNYSNRNINIQI